MGNFSTDSFPNNRWVLGDTLSDLVNCIQSIDESIRHAFGFTTNSLTAPFDIDDDGSIVVQTSIAIGTSNAMIDVVDSIPASPGANEDQKLAHVEALRNYITTSMDESHTHEVYVEIAGDTMTGDLIMDYGTAVQVDVGLGETPTDAVTGNSFGIVFGESATYSEVVGSEVGFSADLVIATTYELNTEKIRGLGSDPVDLEGVNFNGGRIFLANDYALQGYDTGGTGRDLIYLNSSDEVYVGNTGTSKLRLRGTETRPEYDSVGGSWKDLALHEDLDSYLPLAGGTLTGNLTIGKTLPSIFVDSTNFAGFKTELFDSGSSGGIRKHAPVANNATVQIDPKPLDGSSNAYIYLFADADTTGDCILSFYDGDASPALQHSFDCGAGDVALCQQDGGLTVGTTNYFEVESDGTVVLHGDARVWDDLRVAATSTKKGGSKDPDFAIFKNDGEGSPSQGVFVEWFSPTAEEELYFAVQMPHRWDEGTDIECHVHWVSADTAAGAGTDVCWGLEYTWADINEVFGNTTIIYGDEQKNGATETITVDKHYLTEIGTITGTGYTLSSMLVCRIFRDATGAGGTDDYDDDAGLMEIDFHYQINTLGSNEEYVK